MTPDDPRHGTLAGYKAGCQQDCCRSASARYERGREWDRHNSRPRIYPVHGFRRRYQALRYLGWSVDTIAEGIGIDVRNLHHKANGKFIYAHNHHAMVDLYERLSMTLPTDRMANRRRTIARRKGFAPPLAWDNIDDPNETPSGTEAPTQRSSKQLLAEFEWLIKCGESDHAATQQLGVTLGAIERARCRTNDRKAA